MNKSNKILNKKRFRKEQDSESEGSSDDLSETEKVQVKPKSEKKKSTSKKSDDDDVIVGEDEVTFKLNLKKRVNVRKFKGNVLVDIREYWMDDSGNWKPGKKGISLTEDIWKKLKNYMEDVDESIKNMK